MTERSTTGLTGRSLLIALIVLAALLAATAVAMSARHDRPLRTNAVDSASSDLAAGAAAAR